MSDVDARPVVPVVALVGLMGSGKSTVARLVAARSDRAAIDLDELIAEREGRTVAEIFSSDGEGAFRALELAALAEALDSGERLVVATGGGVVTTASARALLTAHATVVWLDAPVDVLVERVGSGDGRPLLSPDPRTALESLAARRRAFYAEVADVVVDASASPDVVATRITDALEVHA